MENIIKICKEINPEFDELTTQEQFEFIVNHVNSDVIKEDLVFYYESKFFGWPYSNKNFKKTLTC